jgi:hypothetical protein
MKKEKWVRTVRQRKKPVQRSCGRRVLCTLEPEDAKKKKKKTVEIEDMDHMGKCRK